MNKYIPKSRYDPKNKDRNARNIIKMMLIRTSAMFEYKNLPETIPARNMELILQTVGNACFAAVNGNYYVFEGGLGGYPDAYYRPTIYTINNPALNYNAMLKIGEECEIIRNDALGLGIMPILEKYAYLLAENEITLRTTDINSRIVALISAGNDQTRKAADKFLKDVEAGVLGVIGAADFLESLKAQPYGTSSQTNSLTDLIEYEQYLKASMFNELGLQANWNMKRESLNSNESQLNKDSILPLVDNMLENRRDALERINKHYGLNIAVDFASAWDRDEPEESEKEVEENDAPGNSETETVD